MLLDLQTPCVIESLMQGGFGITDTPYGRQCIEDQLPGLWAEADVLTLANNEGNSRVVLRAVEPGEADRYRGDFIWLLRSLGEPPSRDYINMRLNRLTGSTEYDGETTNIWLILPEAYGALVNQIATQVRAHQHMKK